MDFFFTAYFLGDSLSDINRLFKLIFKNLVFCLTNLWIKKYILYSNFVFYYVYIYICIPLTF